MYYTDKPMEAYEGWFIVRLEGRRWVPVGVVGEDDMRDAVELFEAEGVRYHVERVVVQ